MYKILRERTHFKINTLLNSEHIEKQIRPSLICQKKFRKTYSTTKVNKCFGNIGQRENRNKCMKILNSFDGSYCQDVMKSNGENSQIIDFEEYYGNKLEDKFFRKNQSHQAFVYGEGVSFLRKTEYAQKNDFPSIQNKIKRYESLDEPKKEPFDDFLEVKTAKKIDDGLNERKDVSKTRSERKRQDYVQYRKYFKNEQQFNPKWKMIFQNPLTDTNAKKKRVNVSKMKKMKIVEKKEKNELCDKVQEQFKKLKNNLEGLIKMRVRHQAQFTWEHRRK